MANPSRPPRSRDGHASPAPSISPDATTPEDASAESSAAEGTSTAGTSASTPPSGVVPAQEQEDYFALLNNHGAGGAAFAQQHEEIDRHRSLSHRTATTEEIYRVGRHPQSPPCYDGLDLAELHRVWADVMFARYYYDGGWDFESTTPPSDKEDGKPPDSVMKIEKNKTATHLGRAQTPSSDIQPASPHVLRVDAATFVPRPAAPIGTGFGGMAIRDKTQPATVPLVRGTVAQHGTVASAPSWVEDPPYPNESPIFPSEWETYPRSSGAPVNASEDHGRSIWQEESSNYTTTRPRRDKASRIRHGQNFSDSYFHDF